MMATVVTIFDTVPLSSATICCMTLASLRMSSVEILVPGARPDWPDKRCSVWLCCCMAPSHLYKVQFDPLPRTSAGRHFEDRAFLPHLWEVSRFLLDYSLSSLPGGVVSFIPPLFQMYSYSISARSFLSSHFSNISYVGGHIRGDVCS
jgi:hypothetical protein